MQYEFNKKSFFLKFIVFAITQNLIRADTVLSDQPNEKINNNFFDVKTPQEFDDKVLKNKDSIIAQYHAPWCVPCKTLGPSLQKAVDEQNGKIKLARIDVSVDGITDTARKQGISGVPFVAAYKDGKIVDQMVGLHNEKDVKEFVQKHVEKHQD